MAAYSQAHIRQVLNESDTAPTADAKGDKLEELVRYLFEEVPSVACEGKNILDGKRAHELDLAFWLHGSALSFLEAVLIVECKNTGSPVGSSDVGWFVRKLQDRGAAYGVIVALSGISGTASGQSHAHSEVINALIRDRIKLVIISRSEILSLATTDDLVGLIRSKILLLTLTIKVV